ncbi:MAG: flavodoxin family protein, partial [Mailhella sp.]|nr:flavodoxin family protein [Mailhella sp.]
MPETTALARPEALTGDLVPWARIIYSSRSGNTQSVAEHLAERLDLSAVNAREELAARMDDRGPD